MSVMTTIAERIAFAFKVATGEDKAASGWTAANKTHLLQVTAKAGSRRKMVEASVYARDSLGRQYRATLRHDSTSIENMVSLLREVEARAKALTLLADVLGDSGWYVTPIVESLTGCGLHARKGECAVRVWSNGEADGYDDTSVDFIRDAFEVALEKVKGR